MINLFKIKTVKSLFATLLLATAFCPLAFAQTKPAKPATVTVEPGTEEDAVKKPKLKFLPPAYDDRMIRLSEVLGALHYLRELCGANEGQLWRDQMAELIKAEEPSEARKARMIANFNQGFRGFREIYRECTPVAATASNQYLKEGARISGEIPDRYGR